MAEIINGGSTYGSFGRMETDSIMAEIINGGSAQPSLMQQEAKAYGEEEEDGEEPWKNGAYTYAEVPTVE
jgi:hypothetical protein